jgi:hypothetical protein
MLIPLLLQAVTLLPAPAPPIAPADQAYAERLQQALVLDSIDAAQRKQLDATSRAQQSSLAKFALQGSAQARLTSLIVSQGKQACTDPVARALFRMGCIAPETNAAVSCLLAPSWLPPGTAPALAYLAQDSSKNVSVRAAALARLLEFGYHWAWPLARALLLGGTRADLDPPSYADWQRGPRWELPKRLVIIGLHDWFDQVRTLAFPFEPNAAWQEQQRQMEALEGYVELARKHDAQRKRPRRYASELLERAQQIALVDLAVDGDAIAEQALAWLMPQVGPTLRELTQGPNAERAELATRVLANLPD